MEEPSVPLWRTSSAQRRATSGWYRPDPGTVRALIKSAQSYYNQGLVALEHEDLTTYSTDMTIVGNLVAQAESELKQIKKPAAAKAVKAASSSA